MATGRTANTTNPPRAKQQLAVALPVVDGKAAASCFACRECAYFYSKFMPRSTDRNSKVINSFKKCFVDRGFEISYTGKIQIKLLCAFSFSRTSIIFLV